MQSRTIKAILCTGFLLVLWSVTRLKPKNVARQISLIVPGLLTEAPCLQLFLWSLSKSIIRPGEAILVISGYNSTNPISRQIARDIENYANELLLSYVQFFFREGLHWQNSNRNFGASRSSGPIISFFDGDDILHPNRFLVLQKYIEENNQLELLLHFFEPFKYLSQVNYDFTDNVLSTVRPLFTFEEARQAWPVYLKKQNASFTYCCSAFPEYANSNVQNAWGTMRRYVWERIPQRSMHRIEDSYQVTEAILAGYNFTVIDAVLGFYRRPIKANKKCT